MTISFGYYHQLTILELTWRPIAWSLAQFTLGFWGSLFCHHSTLLVNSRLVIYLYFYILLIVSLSFPPLCRHLGFSSDLYLNKYNYLLNIKHSSRLASEGACSVTTRLFLSIPGGQPVSVHQTLHDVTTQVTLELRWPAWESPGPSDACPTIGHHNCGKPCLSS